MKSFEYASPGTVQEAVALLAPKWGDTELLAGGTDLVALMKDYVVTPRRLVNIKKIAALSSITYKAGSGLTIGALVTLSDLAQHPMVARHYPMLALAIADAASPQIRNRATLGGNLCQRPRCWYFRNGYGLFGLDPRGGSLILKGDNRYHAVLGNSGPAYFVSPSTIAPTLIAFGAVVRLSGPTGSREVALEHFYRIPKKETEREHDLAPREVLTEVTVPPPGPVAAAYHEVRQKHGFDWPLATTAVVLRQGGGHVARASVILGHVAPVPWRAKEAEALLVGQKVTPAVARRAAEAAVKPAKNLGQNGYKVQIARVAVERALLQAVGLDPLSPESEAK
jgi:xanthine dehydrogenase YagS FAD-binding subunit